jgi:hypothetical protein
MPTPLRAEEGVQIDMESALVLVGEEIASSKAMESFQLRPNGKESWGSARRKMPGERLELGQGITGPAQWIS